MKETHKDVTYVFGKCNIQAFPPKNSKQAQLIVGKLSPGSHMKMPI